MSRFWYYIAIIAMILLLLGIGYCTGRRGANSYREMKEKENQELKERIKTHQDSLGELQEANRVLIGKSLADSLKRAEERSKPITTAQTLVNEKTVLENGAKLYGAPGYENNKRALIASYGAQAVENVNNLNKIVNNQRVQIVHYEGIVKIQDTIIVNQQTVIKRAYPSKPKLGFWHGLGVGVATTLTFILLL